MKTFRFICLSAITLILLPGLLMAGPQTPKKDALTTTAITSTGGSQPTEAGANWRYAYELSCNSILSDTLRVQLIMSNTNESSDHESYDISFNQSGTLSGSASLPSPNPFSLTDDGGTVTKDIQITTGSLAPGDYDLIITISAPASGVDQSNPKHLQVLVHVNECTASVPSCFFSDSNGEFLADCSGELVSTSEGGTFMLVNKKNGVIVATNPGQFYYNYIWTNGGQGVDAQVQFGGLMNLAPQGANAVHAYTFDTSGFTQDLEAFDMVNADGTPCGPAGPCTIWIGEDETLWVTWHLAYDGIGSSKPEAGTSCPGDENIGAAVNVVDADDGSIVAGECPATASGYNKR